MKAMILAAGLGTRLRPLTSEIPKPMVPVAGLPNIERMILHLRAQGIIDFAINLHYCPEPLRTCLGNGGRYNVNIEYFFEPEILGTGGGIKNMFPAMGDEPFIVLNGDVLFMPDVQPLMDAHLKSGALASMVIRSTENAETLGAVGIDEDHRVKRLVWAGDKTLTDLYMFTGMHLLHPQIYSRLPDNGCIVRKTYIPMVETGEWPYGIVADTYFCDLGTPADYLAANLRIARGELTIPGFAHMGDGNIVPSSADIESGALLKNAVLGENVVVKSGVRIEDSVVLSGAVITRDIVGKIVLPDGTEMDSHPH